MAIEDVEPVLLRWSRRLAREAEPWAAQVFPRAHIAALAITAEALGTFRYPQLLARDLRELQPTLNDDLLDLFAAADRALANRFKLLNRQEQFDPEFSWEPAGRASRTELHAFDFALDLAAAYRISREPRYARHLAYLIAAWIAANPPFRGSGWATEPLARRLRNWVFAADLARDEWELDPEFVSAFGTSLALQAACLASQLSRAPAPPPLAPGELGLALAASCFPAHRAADYLALARDRLVARLQEVAAGADAAFAYRPNTLHRLVRSALEFCSLFPHNQCAGSDPVRSSLNAALDTFTATLLPDGTVPLFGPAAALETAAVEDTFALAAVHFDSARFKALARQFGILPYMMLGEAARNRFDRLPSSPWSPQRSLVSSLGIARLTGSARCAVIVNANPCSSLEGHADFLSFELALAGQRVVVDSGGYDPVTRTDFSLPAAHNVLSVDDRPARPDRADFQTLASCTRVERPDLAGITVTARDMAHFGLKHHRCWLSVPPTGWIILDLIEGNHTHRLTSYLHFYPTFTLRLLPDRAIARSRSLAVSIVPLGLKPPRLKTAYGDSSPIPAWFSPELGLKSPSSALAMEWMADAGFWFGGCFLGVGEDIEVSLHPPQTPADSLCFELDGRRYELPFRLLRPEKASGAGGSSEE